LAVMSGCLPTAVGLETKTTHDRVRSRARRTAFLLMFMCAPVIYFRV